MCREIFFWFTEYLNYFALIFFGIKLFLKKYDVQTGRKEWVENVIIFVTSMPLVTLNIYNFKIYGYSNMVTYTFVIYIYLILRVVFKIKKLFFMVMIYINSYRLMDLLIISVVFEINNVSRQPPLDFINIGYQRCIYLVFLTIIYGLIYVLLIKGKEVNYLIENKTFQYFMGIFSYIGIICFYRTYIFGYEQRILQYWFFYLLCIFIVFGIFMIYIVRIKNEEENKILNLRNDLMKNHYLELRRAYDTNKMLYHDFKNHVLVLNQLLDENKIRDAIGYINSYIKSIPNISHGIDSGCEIIDIIVNEKINEAYGKQIDLKYNISYIGETGIEDVDYCALLANLMDNAIESCEKIQGGKSFIDLTIIKKNGFLLIKIINTVNSNEQINDNFFVTDKNNKEFHGLGIRSIERVVKKYNGYIEYSKKENCLECFISMSIEC